MCRSKMNFMLKIFIFLIIVIAVINCDPENIESDYQLRRDKRDSYDDSYPLARPGPRYQYRPLIKYRETKRRKKRLFVPNFFG